MINSKRYDRIKALLCNHWRIPPAEFDRMEANDELHFHDVWALIENMVSTDPFRGEAIVRSIFGDEKEKHQKKTHNYTDEQLKRIKQLEGFIAAVQGAQCDDPEGVARSVQTAIAELKKIRDGG